jgi:predicted AAA+ superfamily ATPase
MAGREAVDYRDACTFFSKTYLAAGLSQLLIEVMQRLAGGGKTGARKGPGTKSFH